MTNSDRLQEIRERAEKPHDYFWTTEAGNTAVDDRHWLLQLVTEQQREAERRNALLREAGNELLAFKRGMEKLGYWEPEEDEAFASLLDQIKAATQ